MFLAFVTARHVHVKLVASGRFWCLYCREERDYEHRTWVGTRTLFFMPIAASRGEFVLCHTCECAFDPECLDESSTRFLEELMLIVPRGAIHARPRPNVSLAEYLGHDG